MGAVPVQIQIRMLLVQWPEPLHHLVHRADQPFLVRIAVQRFNAALHSELCDIIRDLSKAVRLGGHRAVEPDAVPGQGGGAVVCVFGMVSGAEMAH